MLGKANEINILEFTSIGEWHDFQKDNPDADMLDIRIMPTAQSYKYQDYISITIIYKEGTHE